MIVGEAPGEREDETHKAFVGPSGRLLTELLSEVGISRQDCYITNVAKCRPPSNRTPSRQEVKTCVDAYFWAEWDQIQPEYVLVLGNAALQGVLGKSGITKHRGSPVAFRGATVFPAFHPAYALRQPRMLPALKADLQRLRRLMRGEESPAGPTSIRSVSTTKGLRWLAKALDEAPEFSFDIETNLCKDDPKKPRYYQYWEDGFRIVSIAFTIEPGTSYVVPLWHKDTPWKNPANILKFLKPILERAKTSAHNGKFDVQGLWTFDIFIELAFDTMIATHILDENQLKGLKPISEIELGADAYVIDTEEKKIDYGNLPWADVAEYNGKDTDYTRRIKNERVAEFKENQRLARVFLKLLMPASTMLTKVERRGVYMDPERLAQRERIARRNLAKIVGYIQDHGAGPINLNSPQQVGKWLYGHEEGQLGLPVIEKTKSGAPSTREGVILKLALDHPELKALLIYRKWAKYLSTYILPWKAKRDKDSRYHPTYKLAGTVTGRLASDFQQVPRDSFIRSIVGAPEGWWFMAADFSQVELRIAAMLANETEMLRIFHERGDMHLATAINVSRRPAESISAEDRKKAKPVNFGFLYGMGWRKFVAYAFENYGVRFTDEEAEQVRNRFFEAYPALRLWHDRQRRLAHRYGLVYSPIGRARHLPDVHSEDRGVRAEAERQAINSPVQSFASDLMLLSMLLLEDRLPPKRAFIIGTVHDEILFQVRKDALEQVAPLIQRTMEVDVLKQMRKKFGADVTVPIEAEVSYGQHWDKTGMKVWEHGY
jgi:uracil-DNA glycosylase family 4